MNSSENWDLKVKESIRKELKKLPKKDQLRLINAIEALPDDPYTGDIEKSKGLENAWRRRVGAFRVKFQIRNAEKVIYVYEIKRRTSSSY